MVDLFGSLRASGVAVSTNRTISRQQSAFKIDNAARYDTIVMGVNAVRLPGVQRDDGASDERPSVARTIGLVSSGIAGTLAIAAIIRWVITLVALRNYGLDTSDEGFYLASAADPDDAVARFSNFGYYNRLLLRLSGGSLGAFRISGLLLILACSAAAAWACGRWLPSSSTLRLRRSVIGGAWCAITAVGVTYYAIWLVTPSYNLLVLAFGLLAFGGAIAGIAEVCAAEPGKWWRPVRGLVGLGVAGVLLTDVKITSGAATAVIVLLCLAGALNLSRLRASVWSLGLGVVIGAFVTVLVHGSLSTTITKFQRASQSVRLTDSHRPEVVWELIFLEGVVVPWLVKFAGAAIALAVAWHWIRTPAWRLAIVTCASVVVAVDMFADRPHGGAQLIDGLGGWWWLRAAAWTLLFTTALAQNRSRSLALGPLIALGGVALAFGSNHGLIRHTVLTSAVYALAVALQIILVVFRPSTRLALLTPPALMGSVLFATSLLQVPEATAMPYRLDGSVESGTTVVEIGDFGNLHVSEKLAKYIVGLQAISPYIPDAARACLVDLAGGTPLSAIVLRARSATVPWVPGGYPGSAASMEYLLQFAPCVDGEVLVIQAPGGTREIALPAVLEGRRSTELGRIAYDGNIKEIQIISVFAPRDCQALLPPSTPTADRPACAARSTRTRTSPPAP